MERYYYHGVSDLSYYDFDYTIDVMLKIASEGLRTRSEIQGFDDKYNHVCLYRRNEEFDYEAEKAFLKSARAGWVNQCYGFIVSPLVEAIKVKNSTETGFEDNGTPITNLVDEWRSKGEISKDKIIGVFFPLSENDSLIIQEENLISLIRKDILTETGEDIQEEDLKKLKSLIDIIKMSRWVIVNSSVRNFTDLFDETLVKSTQELGRETVEELENNGELLDRMGKYLSERDLGENSLGE